MCFRLERERERVKKDKKAVRQREEGHETRKKSPLTLTDDVLNENFEWMG